MLLVGGTWFLGAVIPGAALLHRGALVQLHIAHPTGRLRRPLAVVTVIVAWSAAMLEPIIADPWITLVVVGLVTGAAIDLHLHTHGPARKASLPGLRAAILFAGALALSSANQIFGWQADLAIALGYDALVAGLVLFLLIDLLRPAWTDDTLADLVRTVGARPVPGGLDDEIQRALGDRTARVAYRTVAGTYVDSHERIVRLDPLDASRIIVPMDDDDPPAAVIIHAAGAGDTALLVSGTRAVARLAIANDQLAAEVHDQLREVQRSRRRVVEAAEDERLHFAQRLEQVENQFLGDIDTHLQALPEHLGEAALDELVGLRADLRGLAHGVRPNALTQGGLAAALPEVIARSPVPVSLLVTDHRYPPALEAALYFLVTEGLTNIARHAGAKQVELTISARGDDVVATLTDDGRGGARRTRGTGLGSLTDRIEALGGALTVSSDGRGTTLTAQIPAKASG